MVANGQAMRRDDGALSGDGIGDEDLLARISDGDRVAFAMLVTRHGNRSLAIAEHLLGDRAEAEDVVQESFVKLWTDASRFDPARARFATWFYRVLSNAALDRLRRRRRLVALPDGYDGVDGEDDAEETMLRDQRVCRVRAAIDALPERQRLALVLCHFEGISNREAGEIMKLGVKGVESLLVRARRQLRASLAGEMEE
ncbi:MAG: RNA polymerase sigma factor [Rhodothalassiaceae bacterium]